MLLTISILAQAPDDQLPDVSAGQVLSGFLLLLAMAGSLVMISVWLGRLRQSGHALPAARRQPLLVSPPLLIMGLLVASWMSLAVVMANAEPPNAADPLEATQQEGAEPVAGEHSAQQPEGGAAEEKAEIAPAAEAPAPTSPPAAAEENAEEQFFDLVTNTLTANGLLLIVFGGAILLSQLQFDRSVPVVPGADVIQPEAPPAAPPETRSMDQWPELTTPPATDSAPTVATTDSSASVSDTTSAADGVEDHAQPESRDREDPNPIMGRVCQRWKFSEELRFAGETFLAAYLPTAVLRILIVSAQPELPSHPLLEMINDGVSAGTLILIGLMAIVVAPVVEELLYRVTILGGCMHQRAPVAGVAISALLFSFAHGFPDSLALLPLAAVLGYTYVRRRSYRTVMLVHLIFNGFNMAIAALGMWS